MENIQEFVNTINEFVNMELAQGQREEHEFADWSDEEKARIKGFQMGMSYLRNFMNGLVEGIEN